MMPNCLEASRMVANGLDWRGLVDFVEALRRRVGEYSAELRRDRELVKSALVEPFLRLMGWDPENPEEVRRRGGGPGSADYILFASGDVAALVAVGPLGEVPGPGDYLEECRSAGARCLLVTDGDRWEAYDADGGRLAGWSLSSQPAEQLFREIDGLRRALGLESGRYEELVCYTRWNRREVRVTVLEDPEGLLIRRAGGIPYGHIARMLLEGKIVFLSGGGVDRRNIHYIRRRLEQEVGAEIECFPAIYGDTMGYTLALKRGQKKRGVRG